MVESTTGVHVLSENDLIDIVKYHFYKYGQGFKQVKTTVDLPKPNEPHIGMELLLEPLNKSILNSDIVEKLYQDLLITCKEVTNVENEIMNKVYDMIEKGKINRKTFIALIKKIKGC